MRRGLLFASLSIQLGFFRTPKHGVLLGSRCKPPKKARESNIPLDRIRSYPWGLQEKPPLCENNACRVAPVVCRTWAKPPQPIWCWWGWRRWRWNASGCFLLFGMCCKIDLCSSKRLLSRLNRKHNSSSSSSSNSLWCNSKILTSTNNPVLFFWIALRTEVRIIIPCVISNCTWSCIVNCNQPPPPRARSSSHRP